MWQDEDSHLNGWTKFNNYSFKMNFIVFRPLYFPIYKNKYYWESIKCKNSINLRNNGLNLFSFKKF